LRFTEFSSELPSPEGAQSAEAPDLAPLGRRRADPCRFGRIGLNATPMRIRRDSLLLPALGLSRPWALL